MLDKPITGRIFFEQVIRDNLDLGRPDQVGLVFGRRIFTRGPRPTPGRFRTRIITSGVTPSHRYRVTDTGLHHPMFLTRVHNRPLRTGTAHLADPDPPAPSPLRDAARAYDTAIDQLTQQAGLAA